MPQSQTAQVALDSVGIGHNGGPVLLADDLLKGVEAIAAFIDEPERRTLYLLQTKQIPAGKIGTRWTGSKAVLREHYARLTQGVPS
jgi:hypothetical protein